jgi:DNA replicative helicase MCM subunit Mcm2 (Cdc46/Mcm family)
VLSLASIPLQTSQQHLSFSISVLDLLHYDPALTHLLLMHPLPLLSLFETSVQHVVRGVRQHPEVKRRRRRKDNDSYNQQKQGLGQGYSLNDRDGEGEKGRQYHVRLKHLPPSSELSKSTIGQVRVATDSQHLLQITGTVSTLFDCMTISNVLMY